MGHDSPKLEPRGNAESVPNGAGEEQTTARINQLAKQVVVALGRRGWTLSTAESCTGGGIGEAVTRIPGSSGVYLGGIIAYANQVKTSLLGVAPQLLETEGAVSRDVAQAMALGARRLGSEVSVATTGIAGPGGGSADKPVGLVWIAWSVGEVLDARACHFSGSRQAVRLQAVEQALKGILERLVG
jgi:PncC family amidohydrolase